MTNVLLVDDERSVRQHLSRFLEDNGCRVRAAANGLAALEAFVQERPDLVLLDVMMPKMDGYETCRAIRRLDRETPVVFLSAKDSDDDQIRGLDAGADDYVPKSASEPLLLARIAKALERSDRFSKIAAPVSMTKAQADIYRLLESDRGRHFSYHEIFAATRGEGFVADEGAVRVHISNLRRKLPPGEAIVSKRGLGFALVSR